MMQENNNFETIISTWRRMSGEQTQVPALATTENVSVSMSGDSQDLQLLKKKDEETAHLMPEKLKEPITTIVKTPPVTITELLSENTEDEEKLLKHDNDDAKEAAGDANATDSFPENDNLLSHPDEKKEKTTDKVDSVLPTHQVIKVPPQSTASTPDEEDCGIKCLYYTLLCCDCVLM